MGRTCGARVIGHDLGLVPGAGVEELVAAGLCLQPWRTGRVSASNAQSAREVVRIRLRTGLVYDNSGLRVRARCPQWALMLISG
jgi:hypothetical protein